MKTEVYSWRVSTGLKLELERIARHRRVPISTVVDTAVREWLAKNAVGLADDEEQKTLHAAAARYIGAIKSGNARGSETARETVRKRLSRRYGSR